MSKDGTYEVWIHGSILTCHFMNQLVQKLEEYQLRTSHIRSIVPQTGIAQRTCIIQTKKNGSHK